MLVDIAWPDIARRPPGITTSAVRLQEAFDREPERLRVLSRRSPKA
jgi:hypothetical protein